MIKQVVQYKDFDGKPATEVLYFNITRTEATEMLDLAPRLEAWREKNVGIEGDLPPAVIQEFLDILKLLVEKSYGIRSEDGRKHRKSAEIFDDFKSSAAYDAFVFGMFENPEKALEFMTGIMPQALMEEAARQQSGEVIDVELPQPAGEIKAVEEEVPPWTRENREPTPTELRTMSPEQMRTAYLKKVQG